MPWWACVGLAALSYVILSAMARPVVVTGIQPSQIGQLMTRTVFQGLAMVGQFVVPILCLAAAGVSAAKRRRRGDLALPQSGDRELIVLAAARLGRTRLIDNLEF